jgi:hypothetical protein
MSYDTAMRLIWIAFLVAGCEEATAPRIDFDLAAASDPADLGSAGDLFLSDLLFSPGPEPTTTLIPTAGEVSIYQLLLPGTNLGEAAIVVGADGTLVLLDVGNSNHDDDVREVIRSLNAHDPARQPLQVEWVVLTHFHGDHIGGLHDLVSGGDPLQIVRGVVHRGWTDVGPAVNENDFEAVCNDLQGGVLDVPLCEAAQAAPCASSLWSGASPATSCPGLFLGDLTRGDDDASGDPTYLPLGGGARLTIIAADAFVSDGTAAVQRMPTFPWGDSNEENARSLAGLVSHGGFRYHFAGDLTGSGEPTEPDLESFLVDTWPYGALGVDVVHAHHHGRRTSSNSRFADGLAPRDGRSRNVVAGINNAYVGSPHSEVLSVWLDGNRLADGWFWVPTTAASGSSHTRLIDADGAVIIQTLQGGHGYRVQAAGSTLRSHAFPSLR